MYHGLHRTVFTCNKKNCYINTEDIRMISEGSCDTEDWKIEKSDLHHHNICFLLLLLFNWKTVILNCINISHYYCFYFTQLHK